MKITDYRIFLKQIQEKNGLLAQSVKKRRLHFDIMYKNKKETKPISFLKNIKCYPSNISEKTRIKPSGSLIANSFAP